MENKWLPFLPVIASIFLVASLSACSSTPDTQTIRPSINIPPQMLQCDDAGPRPTGQNILESQVARYISQLEQSNKDCKTQLKGVDLLIKCYNDENCNVDKLAEYIGLVREPKQD